MEVADLVAEAGENGILDFGLTDHIHTPFNLPDIASSRADFESVEGGSRFHFGVEASCVSQWELDEIAKGEHENPVYGLRKGGPPGTALAIGITADDIATYNIEYVVAGTHWPMYVELERWAVIHDYHRQNMFLATHPLVDIVAHPWWWMGHWEDEDKKFRGEPWFDDFTVIPQSLHDEFAAAAVEHDTAVEINIGANLLNKRYPEHFAAQYVEYIAYLQSCGVKLAIGSDCHSAHYRIRFEAASQLLEKAGVVGEFWCLAPNDQ